MKEKNLNYRNCFKKKKEQASGQDSGVGRCGPCSFPHPHQNYDWITEPPSFRIAWNIAEQKSLQLRI